METASRPGHGTARPWARLKVDGGLAAVQPEPEDRAALDPYCGEIKTLQMYAGGALCFIFRGAALDLVLHSHWLRRQRLVAHNAGFELSFIRHSTLTYRGPPARPSRFRLDCSLQATGLLLGVEHGGGRSLATAAKAFLGLDVPKDLQTSDWAAPVLSPGQLAYAATDAIIAWRRWPGLVHRLCERGRWDAYELQRSAIPAVADMRLRGMLLDIKDTGSCRKPGPWS